VIISEPSFNQNWIHFLLTQRSFDKKEVNIIQELDNIKKIEKNFYDSYIYYDYEFIALKKILRKVLKITFSIKFLNSLGNFLLKVSNILKNFK
jgi:hypothetical protein